MGTGKRREEIIMDGDLSPSFHWCYAKHCTCVTNFWAIQHIWNPAVQHCMLASLIRQCTEFLRICHRSFAFSQDFAITSWSWKHLRVDVVSVIFSSLHRTILFLSSVQAILRNASHTESLGLISIVSGRHIMVSLWRIIVRLLYASVSYNVRPVEYSGQFFSSVQTKYGITGISFPSFWPAHMVSLRRM